MPTPNSARRAPREKKEEKQKNGREEKDERGADRSKPSFNTPADFYRMGQVKEEVGAIPIHTALRPKKESFHQLPPSASRRNDNPNQSSSYRRDGDPKSEWNHRQREWNHRQSAPSRERSRDWTKLKIEPQKNLEKLKTAAEYPIWKFRWVHMMKVFLVPPSFYTDDDPHYEVPTRVVYDIDSGMSFEEKLVTEEMESYLFSLLLTNLDNKWIHLVTGVLDGNFRQAWFKIQAQFDGNSRRSRIEDKEGSFLQTGAARGNIIHPICRLYQGSRCYLEPCVETYLSY
jgi:hypothetical protein